MKKRHLEILILNLLILNVGGILTSNSDTNPKNLNQETIDFDTNLILLNRSPASITVDGNITMTEWENAQVIQPFFLDLDNDDNPPNYDTINYLYIDEDENNVYMAVDLTGDQTNNQNGEWFGAWFNTNEQSTLSAENSQEREKIWSDQLNNGFESLMYDVDNQQEWEYFNEDGNYLLYPKISSQDQLDYITGDFEGTYEALESNPDETLNITSVESGGLNRTELMIEVDLKDFFNVLPEVHVDEAILSLGVRIDYDLNTSISSHTMNMYADNGTTFPTGISANIKDLGINSGSDIRFEIPIGLGNLTTNDKIKFSIIAEHSEAFFMQYRMIDFYVNRSYYHSPGPQTFSSDLAYTSLNNYEIEWKYGGSVNNASDHRMFELQIPKDQLEGYYSPTKLGVIIGGYGTASFEDTDFWCYQTNHEESYMDQIEITNSSAYINYTLEWKGYQPEKFILSSNAGEPTDMDGMFNLTWTGSNYADNYTIYSSNSTIGYISNDLTIEGTTTNHYLYDLSVDDGTKYYIVQAKNKYGTYLSNVISVTIDIPEPPGTFVVNATCTDPCLTRNFYLIWSISEYADNYSVYGHDSPIYSINDSISLLNQTTYLKHAIFNNSDGDYYFAILAINGYGETLSNCLYIDITLDSQTTDDTTDDDTTDDDTDPTDTKGIGPWGIVGILAGSLAVLGIGAIIFFISKEKIVSK